MLDVSLYGAFLAGILSFVSPCVLPLVPPYLAYIAGVSIQQLDTESEFTGSVRRKVVLAAAAFIAGFSTVFIALGASASLLGQFISEYLTILGSIAGGIIILFGLHFLGVFRISLLYREARLDAKTSGSGILTSYIMGLAFAFGWTPCVGPILAAILTVAGTADGFSKGITLLGAYSLGIGVPFMIAALFAPEFMKWMKGFRKNFGVVEKIVGVLLIITGLLFLNNNGWIPFLPSMQDISFWVLETFPALQEIESLAN